jgi:hypothetical protein
MILNNLFENQVIKGSKEVHNSGDFFFDLLFKSYASIYTFLFNL